MRGSEARAGFARDPIIPKLETIAKRARRHSGSAARLLHIHFDS